MHDFIKLGLAAALLIGGSAAANAEDVKAGAAAGADTSLTTSTDATTTGSVGANANYGSLISNLQSSSANFDVSSYNDASTINCVTVSSLQGDTDNGASLDSALASSQDRRTTLQGDIQSNTSLWSDIQSSCTGVADLQVQDVLAIESGADGAFTVYIDDRA
jgi:hypothetical protein